MREKSFPWRFCLPLLAAALLIPLLGRAQSTVPPRITQAINNSQVTTLYGNIHPLARAGYDQGAVADSQPIRRMLLLLRRSPEQESSLRSFIDAQQSKSTSSSFHHWLTPQQFGLQFGPADADIQAVTNWLASQGFEVNQVSAGRTVIEFSGTAGQVRNAFHTQIHRYLVNGEQHFANSTNPQIPTALAPAVVGPVSLNNFKRKAQNRYLGVFRKTKATGEVVSLAPQYSFGPCQSVTGAGSNCNAVGPGDFAAIYDLNTVYNNLHLDGSGQTIAIIGDSEICTASTPSFSSCVDDDAATYRNQFGLSPANLPNVIVDGPTPGFNGDEIEGDLDTQLVGAVARNATIDFVIAADTESTAGIDLAAEYVINNNLAPVMSESFGLCEAYLGSLNNQFYATLWEQAAAQGITVIISSGDNGSAGCDDPNSQQFAAEQYFPGFGTGVNGIASTPFNVAAGGTDFDVTLPNYEATYWSNGQNSTVNGISLVSATQFIPETTWNDSCAQSLVATMSGTLCNATTTSSQFLNIVGGGGGQSNCSGLDPMGQFCQFSYPKPSWQPAATGSAGLSAANDLTRDIPDISLFSADGLISNSFYVVCESDILGGPCDVSAPYFQFLGVGGTSSAAPAFAGIMALVNQAQGPQGQANYVLYNLAKNFPGSFHDVSKGNNSVPCAPASTNCSLAKMTGNALFGILDFQNLQTGQQTMNIGYTAGIGLDLATGLGSVDVANLINNWATAQGNFTATTPVLCLSMTEVAPASCMPQSITATHGTKVFVDITVNGTVSGMPIPVTSSAAKAEDVALIGTYPSSTAGVDQFISNNYLILNSNLYPLTGGIFSGTTAGTSCPGAANCNYTQGLVGGTYTVTAHYAGDGTFGSSFSSPGISVNITPEASAATQSVIIESPSACIVTPPASSSFVPLCEGLSVNSQPYGSAWALRVDVVGSTSGFENATGNVVITGLPAGFAGSYPLNSEGYLEVQSPGNFGATTGTAQIPALPPGMYNFTSQYCGTVNPCGGDPSYNASSVTPALAFTVTEAPTQTSVTPSSSTITKGSQVTLFASVDTLNFGITGGSIGNSPSGTITFMDSATMAVVGTAPLSATFDNFGYSAASASFTFSPTATASYVAVFSDDGNYTTSTSTPVTVTVNVPPPPTLAMISPPGGAIGSMTNYTFTGANFVAGATSLVIPMGANIAAGPVTVTSSTTLTVMLTVSGTTTGPVALAVQTVGGTSGTVNFGVGSDFSITANPTSQTVTRGSTGMTTLMLSTNIADAAYPGPVRFSVVGLPTESNCTLNGSSCTGYALTPANGANMVNLVITTTAPSLVPPGPDPGVRGPLHLQPWTLLACLALLSLMLALLSRGQRTGRPWRVAQYALAILLVMTLAGTFAACGGGGGSGGGGGGGGNAGSAPLGPNIITITATSGNVSHPVMFTMTLQ